MRIFCLSTLFLFGAITHCAHAQSPGRNILLLIADDLGVDAAEFYPTSVRRVTTPPAPRMPNLKRLAQEGVLFSNAWGNALCTPARAALFTGRYGFRTGIGGNSTDSNPVSLARSEVILPELLTARPELNYVLGHIGKWHVSPGSADPRIHGWPYFAGPLPERSGVEDYFSWDKVVNNEVAPTTTYATTDFVNEALALIRRAKRQGRPYFVQVAFAAPHSPYHLPPLHLHSHDSLSPFTSSTPPRPYFEAMTEALDSEIGRLLRAVEPNLGDTTVIFVGDNGTSEINIAPPYPGDHAKGSLYEGGIRVPMLITGAGVTNPGRVATGVVNLVDLFPTVLDLVGIPLPSGVRLDGVSLLPVLRNSSGTRRTWAYSERFVSPSFQRAIRNASYKLIKKSNGAREFYNLSADPFEARNLIGQSLTATQKSNLDSLSRQLDTLLASH